MTPREPPAPIKGMVLAANEQSEPRMTCIYVIGAMGADSGV
jgi:hypothetical protein